MSTPAVTPAAPASDPIDEFTKLPEDQQMQTLQSLAPEDQDKLLDQVRQRKSASAAPAAPVAPPTQSFWSQLTSPLTPEQKAQEGPILGGISSFGGSALNAATAPFVHPIQTAQSFAQAVSPDEGTAGKLEMLGGPAAPFIYHTAKNLYNQAQTEGIPAALGSLVGGVEGGEAVGAAAGVPAAAARIGLEKLGQAVGKTARVARDTVNETQAANEAAQAKFDEATQAHQAKTAVIQAKNATDQAAFEKAQADHQAAVDKANEVNQAAAQDQTTRGQLARQLQQQSARLVNRVQRVAQNTKANLDQAYSDIRRQTAGAAVPRENLADAVNSAEGKLKGSNESIKIFRDILAKAPEEAEPASIEYQGAQIPQGHPLYDVLREQNPAAEGAPPATFGDLQGYYSELGEKLAGGNLPGDVYQAMRSLQTNIGDMMQKMANQSGVGAKFRTTQNLHRDYMQTFRESAGPNHSGSPLAQSLDAADPSYAIRPLTAPETAARVRNMLARFDPGTNGIGGAGPLYDNFRNLSQQYEATGQIKPVKVPTNAPTPPTPKPLPKAPVSEVQKIGPEDIQAAKAARIQKQADRISDASIPGHVASAMAGYALIHNLLHGNLGGIAESIAARGAFGIAQQGLARALESPRVVEWLSKPSPADLEQLARLPDAQRTVSINQLRGLVQQAQARHVPVSAKLLGIVGLTPQSPAVFQPQVATGTSGNPNTQTATAPVSSNAPR